MSDSDNWYIVDTAGDTQGPMDENALIRLYLNESIHSKTYVWDGASVAKWTALVNVPLLFGRISRHYAHEHDVSGRTSTMLPRSDEQQNQYDSPTDADTVSTRDISDETHPPPISSSNDFASSDKTESKTESQRQNAPYHKIEYSSELQFLGGSCERTDLMQNIRNGVRLRNQKVTELQQNQSHRPPKRLRDDFAPSKEIRQPTSNAAAEQYLRRDFVDTSRDSKHIRQPYDRRMRKANNQELGIGLSLSTDQSSSEQSSMRARKVLFSDEVAGRLSAIRQKFGEVEVVSSSRKGPLQQPRPSEPMRSSLESGGTLKSRDIARRIAKLKHKLDELTDKESWLITRVENILLTKHK